MTLPREQKTEKCWDDGWIWNPITNRYDRIIRLEEGGIGSRIRIQPSVYQPEEELNGN